jgi:hypothetical protein
MRNSPPVANASANYQSPRCIHARLPLRHQANFAGCTRAATIGFFYAMLQKDHATEYQLPVKEIAIPPMA